MFEIDSPSIKLRIDSMRCLSASKDLYKLLASKSYTKNNLTYYNLVLEDDDSRNLVINKLKTLSSLLESSSEIMNNDGRDCINCFVEDCSDNFIYCFYIIDVARSICSDPNEEVFKLSQECVYLVNKLIYSVNLASEKVYEKKFISHMGVYNRLYSFGSEALSDRVSELKKKVSV